MLYSSIYYQRLVCLALLFLCCCQAWIVPSRTSSRLQVVALHSSTSVNSQVVPTDQAGDNEKGDNEDEDEDEFEYVEYDTLTEEEFLGSEWLVGTVMDSNTKKVAETWCRLAVDKDGKNVAIWGDKSEGNWNWDVANQFLSFSKTSLVGKDIWAGVVEDYYYMAGTVRGWSFFSPASVLGQWQAKRLGADPEEAGTAPWNEQEEEEEDEDSKKALPEEKSD
jgi:hypothetical protein